MVGISSYLSLIVLGFCKGLGIPRYESAAKKREFFKDDSAPIFFKSPKHWIFKQEKGKCAVICNVKNRKATYAHVWCNQKLFEHYQGVRQRWIVDFYYGTPKKYEDDWDSCCGADTFAAAISLADSWIVNGTDPCGDGRCTSNHIPTDG